MDKETGDIKAILSELKKNGTNIDELKDEIDRRGLTKDAAAFEKKYKNQINDFIGELNSRGEISTEEKARIVMEMKNKLNPSQQKQFGAVLNALKKYLKNR